MSNQVNFEGMSKEELLAYVQANQPVAKGPGMKEKVLGELERGIFSIEEMGANLNTSKGNVSSYLSYLREDGFLWVDDVNKRKVLVGRFEEKSGLQVWKGGRYVKGDEIVLKVVGRDS